ncbi:MAG: lamin tail domain-containing protein [Bacteroidota bacterium]
MWTNPLDAQVLYNEGFDVVGEGAVGVCSTPDATSCATFVDPSGPWGISGDFSGLLATTDWFQTRTISGETVLEAQDVDTEVCFVSDAIDISGHPSVTVSVDVSEVGDHEGPGAGEDYVDVILMVDGSSDLIVDFNGLGGPSHTLTGDIPDDGDWGSQTVTGVASGSSLVVKVCVVNGSGSEQIRIDNVIVEVGSGTPPSSAPAVVINEINYNPIESGTDLTEFLEFLNLEEGPIDLSGWYIDPSEGVDFVFPPGASIGSGEYVVIAGNAAEFEAKYGCAPDYEWSSGALSNGGEDVVLRDASGDIVDAVDYDNASPWPFGASGPGGNGPSLELLDPSADNFGPAFWGVSIVDGGTPGAMNQTADNLCPLPSIVVDYKNSENGSNAIHNKFIKPQIRIRNVGTDPVDLTEITARYFFTSDGVGPMTLACLSSDVGCASTIFSLSAITPALVGADRILELGFSSGMLMPGARVNTKSKIGNLAGLPFDESNDFSSIGAPITDHVNNPYIALYYKGRLIQGSEPDLGGVTRTIQPVEVGEAANIEANVYPNPFANGFVIELADQPETSMEIRLTNMMGQSMYRAVSSDVITTVKPRVDLAPGVYILQLIQGEEIETIQLVKE